MKVGNAGLARKRPSLFVELVSGSVGGAAQVLVGQPLDTIKTRAQIAPSEFNIPAVPCVVRLNLQFRGDVCRIPELSLFGEHRNPELSLLLERSYRHSVSNDSEGGLLRSV